MINEKPITYLINTHLVLNTLNIDGDITESLYNVFVACKFLNHNITSKSIIKWCSKNLGFKHDTKTIKLQLTKLAYYGYIQMYKNDKTKFRLKDELKTTTKLIYGDYNKEYWIDCKNEKIRGLNYITTIGKRIKLNGKKEFKREYFKFFEKHNCVTNGFHKSHIKIFDKHSLSKFRKGKYNSFRNFINEEIVCRFWNNRCVTKWDICRVLHTTKASIDSFKCDKKLHTVANKNEYNKEIRNIDGAVYTKKKYATKFRLNDFLRENIIFNDSNVSCAQKKNQKAVKWSRQKRYSKMQAIVRERTSNCIDRLFYSAWKNKCLLPKLDNIFSIIYFKQIAFDNLS